MYGSSLCFQLIYTLVVIQPFVICQSYETINTRLGYIRGEVTVKDEEKVYQFRKIPYAKPPIGNLRFRKPLQYGPWNSTLDATNYPPSCMQVTNILFVILLNKQISEDCLYLNIYVPRSLNTNKTRPVMIWIHGGSLNYGQASSHDGSDLALKGDVIVVTINYRLGIFGFVSSGDHVLPGNYGLWDQRMAIMWVKDNIADFSGDPESITLFGSSAGSWSVNIHALNAINRGLFHRIILQSGTILSLASLVKTANFMILARLVHCHDPSDAFNNYTDIVSCLRQKSPQELLDASTAMSTSSSKELLFTDIAGAVIDGEMILDYPSTILKNITSPSYNFFRSLDVIIGTTNGEGSVLGTNEDFIRDIKDGMSTSFFCGIFCKQLVREFYKNNSLVSEAVCNMYKVKNGDTTGKAEQGRQATNMVGDLIFITPAIELLDMHSVNNLNSKSFQYSFESELVSITTMPFWNNGSNHGSEVVFLFNFELWAFFTGTIISEEDKRLKDNLCKYWTNFAKTGNPNTLNDTDLPIWLEYNLNNGRNYIELNNNIQSRSKLFSKRVAFWEVTVPALVNPVIRTNTGKIKGETVQYPTGAAVHFRGIPYAKPPVNNLRFEKPEAVDKWDEILDTTHYRSACMQKDSKRIDRAMSEDCLYLNIYSPGLPGTASKKAVMIWFHDNDHFTSGKGDTYDGSLLALKGDVIVVNFNYRLDVFGFLTSSDTLFKGNYGLWDQRLVLTWIKNNIEHFGGNNSAITIFGDGVSVTLQTISPLNKGLFQRVIAQGGNALSPLAFSKFRTDYSVFYSTLFQCENKTINQTDINDCLKNKPARDFFNFDFKVQPFNLYFKPTIDGELIPLHPLRLIVNRSTVNMVDMMVGVNSGEVSRALVFLRSMYNASITDGVSREFVCGVWTKSIINTLGLVDKNLPNRVCQMYKIDKNKDTETNGKQALSMFIDAFSSSTMIQFLKLISKQNSKTFQYLFSRENTHHNYNQIPLWVKGSKHGTELGYIFQTSNVFYDSADYELSDKITAYWSNFAKTGDPNSDGLPKWTNFGDSHGQHYIEFCNDTVIRQKQKFLEEKMKFWFDIKGLKYTEDDGDSLRSHSIILQPTITVILTTFVNTICLLILWNLR